MSEEYPFYPMLPEEGKQEAQALVNDFKKAITKAAQEVISNMYCDVAMHIESDSWGNYRNVIMDGFKDYHNKVKAPYDFKEIRTQIYKENRDEIIADLNQDLLEEIERLKKHIEYLEQYRRL